MMSHDHYISVLPNISGPYFLLNASGSDTERQNSTEALGPGNGGDVLYIASAFFQSLTLFIFFLLGISFNVLLCYAIVSTKTLRKLPYFLMLNLSLVCVFTCVFCLPIPMTIIATDRNILADPLVCRLTSWVSFALYCEYIFTHIAMVMDRLFATVQPILYHQIVKSDKFNPNFLSAAIASWALSFLLTMAIWLEGVHVHFDPVRLFCVPDFEKHSLIWGLGVFGLAGFLCMLVIGYVVIIFSLGKHEKSFNLHNRSKKKGRQISISMIRALTFSFASVAVSLLCLWTPFLVIISWVPNLTENVKIASTWFLYSSCFVTPLIFAYPNKNIRRAVDAVLFGTKPPGPGYSKRQLQTHKSTTRSSL